MVRGSRRWEAKSTGRVYLKKNGLSEIIKIYDYYIGQTRLFSVVSSDMSRAQTEKKKIQNSS